MITVTKLSCVVVLILSAAVACGGTNAFAQDLAWHIVKSSGDVWLTRPSAQSVPANVNSVFGPEDNIRTGHNGSVFLVRGKETMLISSNTEVTVPKSIGDGMTSTIVQRTGSILFEIERGEVEHFEVETPFLTAVAKAANFQIVLEGSVAHVDVLRGAVEVSDSRSGQHVVLAANQTANIAINGPLGLSLSRSDVSSAIQQSAFRPFAVPALSLPAVETARSATAPFAEQASREGQPDDAAQPYGAAGTNPGDTKAAIEKFFATPAIPGIDIKETKAALQNFFSITSGLGFDARDTKASLEDFLSAPPGPGVDARETRAALEKFLATPPAPSVSPGAEPSVPTGQEAYRDSSDRNSVFDLWPVPVGVGLFVAFVVATFRKSGQTKSRLDYNY